MTTIGISGVWLVILILFAGFAICFWRQSSKFEKFFGFEPNLFNINVSQRPKVEKIIRKKRQELMNRP